MILEGSKMEKPIKPCANCGGNKWWQRVESGHYICGTCHPTPNTTKGK